MDAQLARRERMPTPRPSGQWMRRTWVREATVGGAKAPLRWEERRVEQYTEALEQNRDSRDRHRMLYLALSRVGELGKALDVAESWWARDRLDPEALERMAEIEVSRGRADRAVRLIGGLADLQPREASVHERLAAMYDAAGRSGAACAHRRALAALRPDDADALAAAHRCLVENDRGAAAEALVDRVENEMTRSRLRARLAESVVESGSVGRDLRIEADWDGVAELDLVLVHPDGRRSSWIGGVTGIAVKDADARREERIGLRTLQQGAYRIEVVRRDSDDSDRTVSGTLRIRAMGTDRRIRFTIGRGETRVSAASIDVTRREVLVPTDTPPTDFL
jgi:tetratricopeptide (TPR) repeat protein